MKPETILSAEQMLTSAIVKPADAAWLNSLRQSAADRFTGLPGRKTEQWKYTVVPEKDVRPPLDMADPEEPVLPEPLVTTMPTVVMSNGKPLAINARLAKGVTIQPLAGALESADETLVGLVESLQMDGLRHAFSQLNTAALQQGLYIHVAAGVDGGELLLQWSGSSDSMSHSRVCIVLEKGAGLRLAEQFENGSDNPASLNVVQQVTLGEEARLVHSRLQNYVPGSLLVGRTEITQSSHSHYSFTGFDLGAGLARHDVRAEFRGEGAEVSLNAAVLGSGSAHVDYHLEADHQAINCQSRQLFRAVAGGRSKVVFNGRVHVAPGADGSDSQQSSAGMLLSRLAEIDAKPELEILADEVVAAHGATVGQLDRNAMFYLRSRGIGENEARKMLTLAFCRSVIDQLPHQALHEALGNRLIGAMDRLENSNE